MASALAEKQLKRRKKKWRENNLPAKKEEEGKSGDMKRKASISAKKSENLKVASGEERANSSAPMAA
jgi:hypothetical protein